MIFSRYFSCGPASIHTTLSACLSRLFTWFYSIKVKVNGVDGASGEEGSSGEQDNTGTGGVTDEHEYDSEASFLRPAADH